LWDIKTGQCLSIFLGHQAAVRCVQYDGRLIVSGAYDYLVKVWDAESEICLHTLSGHTNRVYSLQVSLFLNLNLANFYNIFYITVLFFVYKYLY